LTIADFNVPGQSRIGPGPAATHLEPESPSVGQIHVGLMFSLVLAPMIMFGCAYYPWSALKSFPILQKVVLVNPLVYACEGLRATLAPQFSHLSMIAVLPARLVIDGVVLAAGLSLFQQKALS
jgi:ABC-2 type transport system permease protein